MNNNDSLHRTYSDIASIDRNKLVDIRDVKVNTALPKMERAKDFIRQIGNPYCYRHGKYVVLVAGADLQPLFELPVLGFELCGFCCDDR